MNKTIVYLGASASAEFIADLFLCPFEAIKVRMQTTLPPYAANLREGWGKIVQKEGFGGYIFTPKPYINAREEVANTLQSLQRSIPTLGPSNSLHHGQICYLRVRRR